MSVCRLTSCDLVVAEHEWPFAAQHALDVEQNWKGALALNPKMFNGDVFVLDRWSVVDGVLRGVSLRTKFAAYLYWRGAGQNERYAEAFATTVLMTRDGGIFLARSVAGTLNEGLYCSPGGLFDQRDVDRSGRIDAAGAAARELCEEVGLVSGELEREPGFLLAHAAPYLAVASVFRSALSGDELLAQVRTFIASESEPELEVPVVVYDQAALEQLKLTAFAHLLTKHVLGM